MAPVLTHESDEGLWGRIPITRAVVASPGPDDLRGTRLEAIPSVRLTAVE